MSKRSNLKLLILTSILIIGTLFVVNSHAEKTVENDLTRFLEDTSSEIFTGKVLSVSSFYDIPENPRLIYSIADIQVDQVLKNSYPLPQIVQLKYWGGTIGNKTLMLITEPGGYFECYPNQVVKIYAIQDKMNQTLLNARQIKDLTPKYLSITLKEMNRLGIIDSYPSVPDIDEYQRLGFATESTWFIDSNDFPVYYLINPSNGDGLSQTQIETAINNAFINTWEGDTKSRVDYTYGGTTSIYWEDDDGVNGIFWRDASYFNSKGIPGYLAVCWIWRLARPQFDIVFNDYYTFGIGTHFDLQSAAVHEAGHTFGLKDLTDENDPFWGYTKSVMTQATYDGLIHRNLYSSDREGVRYLYPDPSYPANTVDVWYPSDGQIIYGPSYVHAYVYGGSIRNVKVQVTSLTDFSYTSGWISMTYGGSYWSATIDPPIYDWYWVTVRSEKTGSLQHSYDWTRVDQQG